MSFCDVVLECVHTGQADYFDCGGNRTRDVWFASPMLYQLSYEVRSIRLWVMISTAVKQTSACPVCGYT